MEKYTHNGVDERFNSDLQQKIVSTELKLQNKISCILTCYSTNEECVDLINYLSENYQIFLKNKKNYNQIFKIYLDIEIGFSKQNSSILSENYKKLFEIGLGTLERIELEENLIDFIEKLIKFIIRILDILNNEVIFCSY